MLLPPATSRTHALRLLRVEVIYHRTSSKITIFLVFRFVCFYSRNGYSSVTLVKWPVFGFLWLVIQHGRPIQNSVIILEILKFLNYSYFAKIMTGKPKIGNLSKMTELYPSVKKCYLRGFCGHVTSW